MQLISIKPTLHITLILSILFLPASTTIAGEHSKSLIETVKLLYKRYSYEHKPADTQLKDERLDVLEDFFVRDLAAAIKADSDCADTTGEICKIDFDILFDSQDSEASNVVILEIMKLDQRQKGSLTVSSYLLYTVSSNQNGESSVKIMKPYQGSLEF